jgi:hypothetical protein
MATRAKYLKSLLVIDPVFFCRPGTRVRSGTRQESHMGIEKPLPTATVQLDGKKDWETFEKLSFENKPDIDWIYYGWLELVYHRDPDVKAGQVFPLWSASAT